MPQPTQVYRYDDDVRRDHPALAERIYAPGAYRYDDDVRRDHPALAERIYAPGAYRYGGLPVVLSSDAPVTVPDVPMACWGR